MNMLSESQKREYKELADKLSFFGLEGKAQDAITHLLFSLEECEKNYKEEVKKGRNQKVL
jgi:hypothetical protein